MERNASAVNVVEKQRLRNTIADQVQRFLRDGGRITVIDGPRGAPVKASQGSEWDPDLDLEIALD